LTPRALAVVRNSLYVAGDSSLVRFDLTSGRENHSWNKFNKVNGLAVDRSEHFAYLAQKQGAAGQTGADTGNVVRFDLGSEAITAINVPTPAGLALGTNGQLYVSAHSDSPARGLTGDRSTGGQLWRIRFPDDRDDGYEGNDGNGGSYTPTPSTETVTPTTATAPSDTSILTDTNTSGSTTSGSTTSGSTTSGTTTSGTTTTESTTTTTTTSDTTTTTTTAPTTTTTAPTTTATTMTATG